MLLAMALVGLGQTKDEKLYTTKDAFNGFWWRGLSEGMKVAFLDGIEDGRGTVAYWYLLDQPVCVDIVNKSKGPNIKIGELVKEVDKLYQTAASVPLLMRVWLWFTSSCG